MKKFLAVLISVLMLAAVGMTSLSSAEQGSVSDLVNSIQLMELLELADLLQVIEEEYGVSAEALVAVAAAEEAAEEKADFDVILENAGFAKVKVIKAVREICGLGLVEAKAIVDSAPKTIKEGVSGEEAGNIKRLLEEAGATVIIE